MDAGCQYDVDFMEPALALWLDAVDDIASMRCQGTLDTRTRRAFLAAVTTVLATHPRFLRIDVTCLNVEDVDGANALTLVPRMAREATAALVWTGLDARRLGCWLPRARDVEPALAGR